MKKCKARDAAHWRLHLQQWEASEMGQAAYCRLFGLKPHQFQYWRRKLSEPVTTSFELVQAPFVFEADPEAMEPATTTATTMTNSTGIRIHIGAAVVEVTPDFDPTTLVRVMAVLRGQDVA